MLVAGSFWRNLLFLRMCGRSESEAVFFSPVSVFLIKTADNNGFVPQKKEKEKSHCSASESSHQDLNLSPRGEQRQDQRYKRKEVVPALWAGFLT
jgi:hypothetical protein